MCNGNDTGTAGGGWDGWHSEGSSLRCLFILFMWDVIYSSDTSSLSDSQDSLQDNVSIFISPYQIAPLDFHHPDVFIRHRYGC